MYLIQVRVLIGSNILISRDFIEDLIDDSNVFVEVLESTAFIFRNNHRENETTPTNSNLLVKYLILSLNIICKMNFIS